MQNDSLTEKPEQYEKAVQEIMAASGVSRAEAELIAAIELGLSNGCLIDLNKRAQVDKKKPTKR